MTTANADDLPVDAILMELARAYVQKGNTEEARKDLHADRREAPRLAVPGRSPHRAREPEGLKSRSG